MAHKGQAKSVVWRLFKVNEDDETKATCNLCNKVLSRGGKSERFFSTTNLNKHLKSLHKEELENEEGLMAKERSETGATKRMSDYVTATAKKKTKVGDREPSPGSSSSHSQSQITLQETLELKKIWDIRSSQAQKIHYAIGEMIALDNQPFSIVEDIGFARLMKLVKPCYQLPSRNFFTTNIIPDMHTKVLSKIEGQIKEACNMSFTTDIWTNNADASFIR